MKGDVGGIDLDILCSEVGVESGVKSRREERSGDTFLSNERSVVVVGVFDASRSGDGRNLRSVWQVRVGVSPKRCGGRKEKYRVMWVTWNYVTMV